MKGRYPLSPLRAPLLLGGVTAFALVGALLNDGAVETVSIVMLASVVGVVVACLFMRRRR